jgi:TPM domain
VPPTRRRAGLLRWLVVLASLALALLATAPAASAEDIPKLTGQVTDSSGALAGHESEISDALATVLKDHHVQVFVVYVATTGDLTSTEFATQTAARNSLGGDDALLLVAMDDRTDAIWVSDALPAITNDEIDQAITGELEPRLQDGDFAGAAIETARALGIAADSPAPVEPTAAPVTDVPEPPVPGGGGTTGGDGRTGGGGSGLGFVAGIVLLLGGGGVLAWWWTRRRRAGEASRKAAADAATLAQRANALLIATDERIRDAQQETDFAEAQYGKEEVVPLRAAVVAAQAELKVAFTIRQKLDDEIPEDEATRQAMQREIVERTTRAQETLDKETDRIRRLRDLERDAPNTLVELPDRIDDVEARLPAAEATIAKLKGYAPSALGPVAGNVEEARKGLAGARDAVIEGSAAVQHGDLAKVAVATETALEGLTGADTMLKAVDQLAATIAAAEARIPTEAAAADQDLADAKAALAGRSVGPVLTAQLTAVQSAIDDARRASGASPLDPSDALRRATEAHRLASAALVSSRDAVAAADRLIASARSSVQTAAAEVQRAAAYIGVRRRGVGDTARTRLAEAQRLLDEATAEVETNPQAAVTAAQRVQSLAQEAYRLAGDDFSDWNQGGPGWGQRSTGPSGGVQAGDIIGGVIGGILAGGMRGGGMRGGGIGGGGGWGGSPWGGGGGGHGGGGWGGGGGFGSGGFGGGGGGGGRSQGGHW